ncbi:hypothetical protein D9M71_564320 [compost metagenome]
MEGASIQGNVAGMEVPENVRLENGSWHYRPVVKATKSYRADDSTAWRVAKYLTQENYNSLWNKVNEAYITRDAETV